MSALIHALLIAAFGAATLLGNLIVRRLLSRITTSTPPSAPRDLLSRERDLPGGRWIGTLERLGIYACIVAGFPVGIGFVLAIKGLGRYPELRAQDEPAIGELFIIGTLASALWACACAGAALGLSALLRTLLLP
ncbi:hypothetical protein M3A96_03015 [Helcobacillus massiliensis]|uniref:Uncharacterized protein n=1 Tax=Helcobacillus massiliensis TaxID=521392 RepID=A0A839QQ57_9MICO|nr:MULTISPECIES: hypothetical protein [Helcobacillus]MBB3022464.1 hypothetical protein [Helcobacillus massiliensis]MCG7427324.1 hypothetical protein [Helcobacillus sp. ACRRO]MCT1557099.1 hypothetical protein [Helcobacillus massiliensis]MCT2036166.1 hypothetical protein [Helcobacillus massiliensis]MCT2331297.1 hypothetical protein [Helcobacillus massiliensis]